MPLNTALLAVQNLEGEGVFRNMSEDHTDMIYGLMGSLNVMEKVRPATAGSKTHTQVLNDVLSFNRMDSGKFTLESNPLDLHKSLQVVAMSHRAQAERSGVGFSLQLDPRIDALPGTLMGDDMRLRQVVSNLLSNALKFVSDLRKVGWLTIRRRQGQSRSSQSSYCPARSTMSTSHSQSLSWCVRRTPQGARRAVSFLTRRRGRRGTRRRHYQPQP